jgi:hypothetical protein
VAITDALGTTEANARSGAVRGRSGFRVDDPGQGSDDHAQQSDSDVLTVILEFDIEAVEERPLRTGIERVIREVLSGQFGFVAGHLHVSRDHRKVLNYLQWESLEAFERFRDDEDTQRLIRPVIGPYGPKQWVVDIVFAAVPAPRSAGTERSWYQDG